MSYNNRINLDCTHYTQQWGGEFVHPLNLSGCTQIYGEFDTYLVKICGKHQTTKDVELLTNGCGIIMCSPDGTKYRVTVANGGTISITVI